MAKAKYERTKPHVNVGTIGHIDHGKNQVVKVQVPLAEVLRYSSDLRSITSGRVQFTMSVSHYEEIPAAIAEKVIAESRKEIGEEEVE